MAIFIAAVITAVVVSFLCSLTEAVLLTLTPARVEMLSGRHPRSSLLWKRLKAKVDRPIAAILILNTTAHTAGASVAGAQFQHLFGERWLFAYSIGFTVVILVFTEILPKMIGVLHAARLAVPLGGPLDWSVRILSPLIVLTDKMGGIVRRAKHPKEVVTSVEEIRALATLALSARVIEKEQARIIHGAARLPAVKVSDIMVPEKEMVCMMADASIFDNFLVAHFNPHTRFPIRESRESPNTLGYVNFKEMVFLMRANPKNPSLLGILRPLPKFAAETPADDVLQTFIATHSHMGLVEDGSGKVLGLVTLEDVMEVLVGEIGEELDLPPTGIHDLGGGSFLIGGGAKLGEVLQATGKSLSGDPKETLSDWLLGRFKGIPRVGDVYREKDIEFLVRRVRRGKVFEVCLQSGEESHLAGVPPAPPAPGS